MWIHGYLAYRVSIYLFYLDCYVVMEWEPAWKTGIALGETVTIPRSDPGLNLRLDPEIDVVELKTYLDLALDIIITIRDYQFLYCTAYL